MRKVDKTNSNGAGSHPPRGRCTAAAGRRVPFLVLLGRASPWHPHASLWSGNLSISENVRVFFLPSNYRGGGGSNSWLSTKAWSPHPQGQRPPARLRLRGPASFPAPTFPTPRVFLSLWRPLGPHVAHFYPISNASSTRASRARAAQALPRWGPWVPVQKQEDRAGPSWPPPPPSPQSCSAALTAGGDRRLRSVLHHWPGRGRDVKRPRARLGTASEDLGHHGTHEHFLTGH